MKHQHITNLCKDHEMAWYNEEHDSYFCPDCKEWLESKCDDSDCEFCTDRPDNSPGRAILKFNNGNGAILCSGCNVIVKQSNYTALEEEAFRGIIDGLEEYYCETCK